MVSLPRSLLVSLPNKFFLLKSIDIYISFSVFSTRRLARKISTSFTVHTRIETCQLKNYSSKLPENFSHVQSAKVNRNHPQLNTIKNVIGRSPAHDIPEHLSGEMFTKWVEFKIRIYILFLVHGNLLFKSLARATWCTSLPTRLGL